MKHIIVSAILLSFNQSRTHICTQTFRKRCDPKKLSSNSWRTGLSLSPDFVWLLFLFLFLSLVSLLPSISAPCEVNGYWKDNGMSSGLAWPLHLLQHWHHIGKLKQGRGGKKREQGGQMGKKSVACVCISEQGQHMALSSRALTTDRGIGEQRPSGQGL